MQPSARTTLSGTVKAIRPGEVEAEVTADLGSGMAITSVVTRASAERLGLKVGRPAVAVIKASDVMVGVD